LKLPLPYPIARIPKIAAALIVTSFYWPAAAKTNSSNETVALAIIRECRDVESGMRCACPDDLARDGGRCGLRSAYNQPGGATQWCYVADVSAKEIADYRVGKRDFIDDCVPRQ